MSTTVSVLQSYNAISSYSDLYSDEISEEVEMLGNFANYNDIMIEVRSTIYYIHRHETVLSYFMTTMSLEEALDTYESEYNTSEMYVCHEYYLEIEKEIKFREAAVSFLVKGTPQWQLNNDTVAHIMSYLPIAPI